jgi:hypothetical protein
MRTLKALVACDDGKTYTLDVLEYAGRRWLVPRWIRKRTYRRPARLISIEDLPHQTIGNIYAEPPHIVVNHPIPKDILSGQLNPGAVPGFVVIKRTRRQFPLAKCGF